MHLHANLEALRSHDIAFIQGYLLPLTPRSPDEFSLVFIFKSHTYRKTKKEEEFELLLIQKNFWCTLACHIWDQQQLIRNMQNSDKELTFFFVPLAWWCWIAWCRHLRPSEDWWLCRPLLSEVCNRVHHHYYCWSSHCYNHLLWLLWSYEGKQMPSWNGKFTVSGTFSIYHTGAQR